MPPPQGLLGAWSGDGTNTDLLGFHNGTLMNGATYGPGEVGQAFSLDGTNAYVDLGAWSAGSQWTIEAWVNAGSTNSGRRTIAGGVGNGYDWAIAMQDGQFGVVVRPPGGASTATIGSGVFATTNTWYYLVGTCDGTNASIYVDGQLKASGPVDPNYVGTSGGTRIGGEACCSGDNFPGLVDEVGIYDRPLSGSEILAIYNAGSAGKCRDLAGAGVPYFTDFEGGTGPEWLEPQWNNAETLGFTHFSGRFGNNFQWLTLTNLVVGQSYTLGFDFYTIDSWDGNADGDFFNVSIGGQQVFHQSFTVFASDTQTYPSAPDEGPVNLGFNTGWPDAIYRNIEIPFTASNAVTSFVFQGQGLEALDNESWGLDNVSVNATADLTNTFIRSTTLPEPGSTNSDAIGTFTISARLPLLAASATNGANYSLVEAGADGLLGTADDVAQSLTPSLPGVGGRSVAFSVANGPLQPGLYRFSTAAGLLDSTSNAVPVFTRDFTIANPILGRIESAGNDALAGATALPVAESPAGSGFFTAFAVGTFDSLSDVDYWSFNAEAGDVITVRLESESQGVYPHLRLRNASDQDVALADGGADGVVQLQTITISTPGTYYLRVWSSNNRSRYWMRLDQSRGVPLELESNDTQASANPLNLTFSPGLYQARVAGSLPAADAAGDYFRLGTLNVGNSISVTALYPTGSVFSAGAPPQLDIQLDGNPVPLTTNNTGTLNFTVVSNGVHYIHVSSTSRALRAQYLLDVSVVDGVPPVITGASLPDEGTTTSNIVDRFSLNFSEDIFAGALSNSANYELRGAGTDGILGTADDTFYTVAVSAAGYTNGLTASYTISDGPLQPGAYRLTVSTNLIDRAGNPMAAPFIRDFTVANLPGYILENRNDDSPGLGTLLGSVSGTNGDGTFSQVGTAAVGSNPRAMVAGQFNADTNLDLVTVNWGSGNLTVLTNTGAGTFVAATNIPTGANPVAVVSGDFNNDGKADLAVANFNGGTVSILLGDGNGGFQLLTNLTGLSNPYQLAAADLNRDGKPDLIVPNAGNGTVTIFLGNGDGTFQAYTNYATGSYPQAVAAGDLNNDQKPDLVVVNYNSATATVLLGNGDGSFQVLTNLPTGAGPRFVGIADVTGDGIPDVVVLQGGENSISVFAGNGDGTFQPRRFFFDNTRDAYTFALADLNGDGARDLVVPGYGNNTFNVLLNNGAGAFTNVHAYSMSDNPVAVAVGDFDGDGRPDAAFCHYSSSYVSIWNGDPALAMTEDPPGSGLRTILARGIRSNSGDVDFWRFSGNAGDQMILAVDTPGNPPASQLYFQILQADGTVMNSFYPDYTGWGQSSVLTLPYTGTYVVRVARSYDYQGEYRLRITLGRPPLQLQNQGITSQAAAAMPNLVLTNAHLHCTLAGYLSAGDGGDYYNLGNLPGGSTGSVGVNEPGGSGLGETLWIYNSSGVLLTNSGAGVTNFTFTVPPGQDDVYYLRVTGSPGGFSGSAGTALRFFGGADHADLGGWFNYQTFTLSMWLNPASSQNNYADILDDNHASGINWVIEQNNNNVNQYAYGDVASVPFSLPANQWTHLAITRDATNIIRVYLNGTLVGTNAASGQINYNGSPFLSLARWVGGSGRGWNGMMDDLRIYDRALSASEVAANMSGTLTGNEPDLIGYWRFDEGTGTNAYDLSPSNHTAVLINGPAWVQLSTTNALPQGLDSQYVLNIDLTNTAAPAITGVTLPANGTTSSNIITSFTVNFSEDMDPRFNALFRNVYTNGGHSYLLTDNPGSWSAGEAAARALGGHLASIGSAAENAWLNQTFGAAGPLWIGLNLASTNGAWTWSSGDALSFSNWSSGQPDNNAGYETAVQMQTDGTWDDLVPWSGLRGLIEVASATDSDGDGLVDSVDPYPADPKNAFDLRAAGPDGLFDTSDDMVYRIYTTGYTNGFLAPFAIQNGPLQPGNYRFEVTPSLTDRFGNPLSAPFVQYFTIAPVSGFITENPRGTSGTSTTSLSLSPTNQADGSFATPTGTAVGANPHYIAQGYFNGDSNLDLVTANYGSGNISVLTNNGNGGFGLLTNIPTGSGPICVAVADFNADTNSDLAVANYNSGTVSILLGDGHGGFTLATNLPGFTNPRNLAIGDFNHDGLPDLAVPNLGANTLTVAFGAGGGTFTNFTTYPVGSGPETVAAGDLDGDGNPDLAVVNYYGATLSVLMGSTNGAFNLTTNYPTAANPQGVTLGDVNGDGRLDALVVNAGNDLSVFAGNGDGTFQARTDYLLGSYSGNYQVVLADINQDGSPDALIPTYNANGLVTALNSGSGAFSNLTFYSDIGGNPVSLVTGDYNHDGIPDIVTANYYGNNITVLLGNNTQGIAFDPAGTGLRIVSARGNLADSSDADYWTFSARSGDQLVLACENPGNPYASSLRYRIYFPDGSQWTTFTSDSYGRGQINLSVPASGTYSVRVEPNNQYYGEYRFRLTLAQPPVQLESEINDSIASANAPALAIAAGAQTATVLGYIGNYDTAGDYYQLGNLAAGTVINLGLERPASSGLLPALALYNSAGTVVTNSAVDATNLSWTVPTGADGSYYAQVLDGGPAPAQTFGGQAGSALWFNGNNSWVALTNGVIPGSGDFTVEAWAYADGRSAGSYREILSQGSSGNAFYLGFLSNNHIRSGDGWQDTGVAFPFNGWHHFALVKSSTNTLLYVDGVLAASRGSAIPNPTATDALRFGRQYSTYGEYWFGDIDEVRIWNVDRSAADIQANLTNRLTGSEPGLVGYWRFDEGSNNVVLDSTANGNVGTFQVPPFWVPSTIAPGLPSSILSQYLLNIRLSGANPPSITSISLPAEGVTTSNIVDRFSLVFSQDMNATTVTNSASYELRCAGPDNLFDTADDQLYTVANSPLYSSGTNASYLITDGPLQPGLYRFSAYTNLTDRLLDPMATNFVRDFAVANIPGFILESRADNTSTQAVLLGASQAGPDGSFSAGPGIGLGGNVEGLAAGRLDGDTNMDLVAALWQGSVAVLLGNGDGSFTIKTNYATGANARAVALAHFDSDSNLDLAVANYGANTVTVLTGNGDGTFLVRSNYAVGTQPNQIVAADLNNDGRTDLVVPNFGSGNVSVLLGNGDGSFQPAANFPAGNGASYAAVGDVNGDGIPDVLVANYYDDQASLLLGNGNGTFAAPTTLATGHGPRALLLADLNGDGKPDLAVFNGGDNTISVMAGNGDGSFQPRVNYSVGTSDGYAILAVDVNGDGHLDLVVDGYYNSDVSVLLNRGDGTFAAPVTFPMGSNPVGLAAADFNNDGLVDLAAGSSGSSSVNVLLGNHSKPLPSDPPLSGLRMIAGRGNIFDANDADYWTFTAQAGDRLLLDADNLVNYAGSGARFTVYGPDGSQVGSFVDYYGRGQITSVLAAGGTYTLVVSHGYDYFGEYRFQATLGRPPLQLESEANNGVGQANAPVFATSPGHQTASMLGDLDSGDGSGDFFALGNLAAGAVVNLTCARPGSSPLIPQLAVYDSSGTLLTNAPAGQTNLSFALSAAGAYYARIAAATGSGGMFSVYVLNIDISDTTPPVISSLSLPADGSTNLGILDRFTLGFNKDLDPSLNALNRPVRLYNGHAYTISDSGTGWYTAENQAQALGGHLVAVNDLLENAFVQQAFGSYGNLWIGLSDEAQHGSYAWSAGDALSYTNWAGAQPNDSSDRDYVAMQSDGTWADFAASANYRGVIEVNGTDSDGDGIPDTLDPFPYDPYNLFDLRAAGPDGVFDTADDQIYHLSLDSYASGLSLNLYVTDGPLQPGYYRFTITGSLRDRFGNGLAAPYVRYFTVGTVSGYTLAGRTNTTAAAATPLLLTEDPTGMKSGAGRGKLFDGNDADWWSFSATNGEWLQIGTEVPGLPAAARLRYDVFGPDGTLLVDLVPDYSTSLGQSAPVLLGTNGLFTLRVTPYDGYYGEYHVRVILADSPYRIEAEANDSIAAATPVVYTANSNQLSASMVGYIRTATDLDYYNLGTVSNGYSIFLSVRQPAGSPLVPVVSVYNSANVYQSEAAGGRSDDGVAEVLVTQTDTYYAVVRDGQGSGGLDHQYVLDIDTAPSGSVSFPNLQVVSVTPPTGSGIQSGQPIAYSFTVQNVGTAATVAANWSDRAVLSTDTVIGNGDDIPLGFFPHSGALNPGESYSVTNTFTLPDGISGDYYVIVSADAGNAVNEFVFENDNTTVSSSTFHVNLAPYPDLQVQGLNVSGPDTNHVYTITWNTTNAGTASAPAGFYEHFQVRNLNSGALLANVDQPVAVSLAPGATVAHQASVTATDAAAYQVQVTTDSRNNVFEDDAISHADAEANNTASAGFSITAYYTVTLQSSPAGAGTLSGAGTYASGSTVTVTAAPDTNTLPYEFVNWTESGAFRSAGTNYTFGISGDRNLTANFTLPSYQVGASNNPPGAGTVLGQGTYFYGSTNVLTAGANFGYRFTNWTQNGSVIASTAALTNLVFSNLFVVANYSEANTIHVVTTATSPTNLATIAGAGTYTNGQSAAISAPASITNAPNIYTFREFRLNGASAGSQASFNKTFSTLDPTNMNYVAVYDTRSILPVVIGATPGFTNAVQGGFTLVTNPVPASTNYQVTLQFDRSMDTNVNPLVVITNAGALVQPFVPTDGVWLATSVSNDTYRTPFITFSNGMDGSALVQVSAAQDPQGAQLAPTNVASLVIDVTPPLNPAISLVGSNSTSAEVDWSGYTAPADLGSFRVYLAATNFSSTAGLTPVSSLGAGARNYLFTGLALDTNYYAAVAAVDQAGNSAATVTPLAFRLASAVPPPVTALVGAIGSSSALVSWNNYDTSRLLGFAGFQLYYETTNFSSVAGLTPQQTLGAATRSAQVDGLDRTKTYYFAVVGYNVNGAFDANVATATWSDPYAGNIGVNTVLGGSGQGVVDILQNITVVSNATLTVPAGTTLRFAPGTGLTVQSGTLVADGTPLDPVVFTSSNDQPGSTPARGDWNGVTLGSGAGGSVLRNVFVLYGGGLTLDQCAPTVGAFTARYNAGAGLTLQNGATLNTTNALLEFNDVGARQLDSAQLAVVQSVIQNNGTNALAAGSATLAATQDWWGSAAATTIAASVQGSVDTTGFLTGEPLLTPAIGTVSNLTQVGSQTVNLRLACRTAETMRLSEDSSFGSVFFTDFTNNTPFQLSAGGGQKTVFAQFRSVTGETSGPVSVTITYVTAGPAISSFNLSEGEVLGRPLTVTGSATAALGVADLEFYVDDVGVGTNVGASFAQWFDVRTLSVGTHRVELVARDTQGNVATLEHNVTVSPTPPPAPAITTPASDIVINTNTVFIGGTAEPFITVRLFDSGALAAVTNAAADGSFGFAGIPLTEGANALTAVAIDALGSASSPVRTVNLDTTAPAQLILNTPVYTPGRGLTLTWNYPPSGKQASSFEVFWGTSFTAPSGHTIALTDMSATIQGLATGDYNFYVVGYDALGNASLPSAPVAFHYDAVPPAFSIAFDKASPVGIGPVHVVLTASEALAGTPVMTVQPYGSSPSLLTLSNSALNTYEADINVTALLPSGPVQFNVSAQDLAGNPFNGPPAGPALVIDVTPPSAVIGTAPPAPVQATNNVDVAVNLQLSEAPKAGTTPALSFGPPIGAPVPLTLTGSDTNWTGILTLTPAMGSGFGHFTLSVTDALDNIGHSITAGESLEIYNTALPSPPGQPVHFQASSLSGGRILLTWSNVPDAEIYRVYSDPGTNLDVPTTLIADNLTSNQFIDLPAADGYFRYVVTASRRGSEGTNSIVRVALSDRTPPPAPTNLTVQLAASGLQLAWQAGAGEIPDHFNIYRNGSRIGTTAAGVTTMMDYPPRGVMSYTVAAADALGNEALSAPVTFQLLVGAVDNLQAVVTVGQAPVLSWTSPDSTAVGFNVYRNGIRQNSTPIAATTFTDTLPVGPVAGSGLDPLLGGWASVNYAVTAVNATNAESAARSVTVYPVNLGLLVNAAGGPTNNAPLTSYFDDYLVSVSNLTADAALPLQQVELLRQAAGSSLLNLLDPVNGLVASNAAYVAEMPVPCASNTAAQSVRVRAVQQTDSQGSSVIYQQTFNLPPTEVPGVMVEVSANQLPLAGGLTSFDVRIYNRGYTPVYFVTARGGGSQPGDLYISVKDPQGQEVSRTPFSGSPNGVIYNGDLGYLMIPAGSSTTLTVPGVLTPAALASNTVTYEAVVGTVYDRVTSAGQQSSGPLIGSMQSSLSQTPYYGTAQTDRSLYSGDQPVVISGQALDRLTGQPVPNVPLKIGFATRGYRWYEDVTTDSNGDYSLTYNVTPGLAGTLTLWAAHPDVVDQLNQDQITIYRIYASPASGDIRMSKNGTLPFTIAMLNPGDVPLTGFTATVQAYQMQGTNQVPISTVRGTNLFGANFSIGAGQKQTVALQLTADANAPDNALVVFTLTSAEGASATFTANVTLLAPVPIVSVIDPGDGYVDVSLDRGTLVSRQVSIVNSGLEDLKGVSIVPPTNVTWMALNLPVGSDGTISLPDLPVGATNTFTVVFTPPTNAVLGFFQDKFTIRGTNALAGFDVPLYARVTSSQIGAIQFYVDDILGLDVPNATVRLRNTALQVELPPVQTDINGLVTVSNLQEGDWSWQVSAPGYSGNVGVTTVVADQTVQTHTRLNKSLVTVNFTVTPVPFSDKYDITIEQTFETHVPIPVLVMTPAYQAFTDVKPGFQATFIVTAKNEGLVQMTDLTIQGQQTGSSTLTPLITYVPVLGAQQSVDIPFVATYSGTNAPGQQGLGDAIAGCVGFGNIDTMADFLAGMAAFAQAYAHCPKDQTAIALAATVAVTYQIIQDAESAAENLLEPVKLLGCILGNLIGPINLPGIGVAINTGGQPQQSVQQFAPITSGCFSGDTTVLLADGSLKRIDQIHAGDVVKSGSDPRAIATVAETYQRRDNTCRDIQFALPGQAQPDAVCATDEHLFWLDGKGWVAAAELQPGQWLINGNGQRVQILSNRRLPGWHEVYTLKLRGDTAFYANGILVHDLCGGWALPGQAGAGPIAPAPNPINTNASK